MKVILNVDAISQPLTGLGTYAYQLAKGLPLQHAIEDVKLYSSHHWLKDAKSALVANQNLVRLRNTVPFKTTALKLYTWQKNQLFKHKSKALVKDYILHSPNFLLMPYAGVSVVTLHDLSFLRYPQTHPVERIKLLEKQLPKSLAQADAIIAVSEFVKTEIQQVLGVAASKIHVVANGVSQRFQAYNEQENHNILKKHNLIGTKYLLTVATLEPRKNLNNLIDAYQMLEKKTKQHYKLVLVGSKGWLSEDLDKKIKNLVQKGEIIRLGYVADEDLPHIYAAASGFVLPSLYEGFGLPILEAMAAGIPVLTSNVSSLPEVAAKSAILVNPHDCQAIAMGMQQLIDDKIARKQMVTEGLALAQHFTWQRCVAQTIKVYQRAQNGDMVNN